jgi:hypothetical protein
MTKFETARRKIVDALAPLDAEQRDDVLKHIAPKWLSDAVRETLEGGEDGEDVVFTDDEIDKMDMGLLTEEQVIAMHVEGRRTS